MKTFVIGIVLSAAPAVASAEPLGLVAGAKLGAGFPQPFGELGTTFVGELELGYQLPLPEPVGRDLEVFFAGRYSAPGTEGQGEPDERLPGGEPLRYEVTQRQAVLTLGVLYRIAVPVEDFRPTVSLGGRCWLQRTELKAAANAKSMGEWEETATNFGPFAAVGGEYTLGPGAVLLELQVGAAALDGEIFHDASSGSLDVLAGYRLML